MSDRRSRFDQGAKAPPEIVIVPDSPAELCPELGPPPKSFTPDAPTQAPPVPEVAPASVVGPPVPPAPTRPQRPAGVAGERVRVGARWVAAAGIVAVAGLAVYAALWGLWALGGLVVDWVVAAAPLVGLVAVALLLVGLVWRGRRGGSVGRPHGYGPPAGHGAPGPHGVARVGGLVRRVGGVARWSGVAVKIGVIGVGALARTVSNVAAGRPLRAARGAASGVAGAGGHAAPGMTRDRTGAPAVVGGVRNAGAMARIVAVVADARARGSALAARRAAVAGEAGQFGAAGYAGHAGHPEASRGARLLTRLFGDPEGYSYGYSVPGGRMDGVEVGAESARKPRDPSVDWSFSEWLFSDEAAAPDSSGGPVAGGEPGGKLSGSDTPTEWMTDRLTDRWCERMLAGERESVHGAFMTRGPLGRCRFCAVGFLFDESDPNGWYNAGTYGRPSWRHHDKDKMFARYGRDFLRSVSDHYEDDDWSLRQCTQYVESWHPRV